MGSERPRGPSADGGGGVEVRTPKGYCPIPAGAADCPHPRLQHPETARATPPGPLTDSADTQATKPKVSRIQARRIFPEDRLGAAAGNPSATKPLGQHGGAAREQGSEQSSCSDRRSGSGGPAPARGALRLLRRPLPSPPRRPGTRRLLTCWFLRSRRQRAGLWGGCSPGRSSLCGDFTPPRAPSPRRGSAPFREESIRKGLEWSCG